MKLSAVRVALLAVSTLGLWACAYDEPTLATAEQLAVDATLCDTLNPITYSQQVRAILAANCYECHASDIATAGVVLDTYDGVVRQVERGLIPGVIRRDPGFSAMPFNRPQIDACQILIIERWIQAGTPDN